MNKNIKTKYQIRLIIRRYSIKKIFRGTSLLLAVTVTPNPLSESSMAAFLKKTKQTLRKTNFSSNDALSNLNMEKCNVYLYKTFCRDQATVVYKM